VAAVVHGGAESGEFIAGERGDQQRGMRDVMHGIVAAVDQRKKGPAGHGVHSQIRDEERRT
jgi:hypothetical protein